MQSPSQQSQAELRAAVVALQYGLSVALRELAAFRGTADLGWLDELEARLSREAESAVVEGAPIEHNAFAYDAALACLRTVFVGVRGELASEPAEDPG